MRRALLMTLIILFCLPIANATQITTNTEDSSSGTFSGTYNVENGATADQSATEILNLLKKIC